MEQIVRIIPCKSDRPKPIVKHITSHVIGAHKIELCAMFNVADELMMYCWRAQHALGLPCPVHAQCTHIYSSAIALTPFVSECLQPVFYYLWFAYNKVGTHNAKHKFFGSYFHSTIIAPAIRLNRLTVFVWQRNCE